MMPDRADLSRALASVGARWLLILLFGCFSVGCSADAGDPALYRKYCSACHGPDGEGLRKLYPALTKSAYMDQKLEQLPCLIVNGAGTTVAMPGFSQLEIAEITDLVSYLNSRWAPKRTKITGQQVETWLHECR
ncbi:MAG: cytochrome c [Desulfofustis sp.]|jgi:mono/diheme cytochrome c family protein